ncbi:MAG: hypothetical protein H6662_14575 [Ardenticatenaceae bacterium]|nr:hypothetical protein [Anaerolineales bacterium]MCB8922810.1 hypothetical protein [Ardenticatenaceae bacterium]MCB8991943.1 hypothetical protein [Ardenticatenaceae bacterium]MCB9004753.1 hypothetical protein [Ardenticatenaceae bacterium]
MMMVVGVDCTFAEDGAVRVRRMLLHGRWQSVEQGRQWLDGNGRHVLIMLPNNQVRELVLRSDTLLWEIDGGGGTAVA